MPGKARFSRSSATTDAESEPHCCASDIWSHSLSCYSYAFTTNLEPIRAQIQQPDADLLPGPFLLRTGAVSELDEIDDRAFLESTTEPRCIMVALNGETIFLPAPGAESAVLYRELGDLPEPITTTFRILDAWPPRPLYRTDRT